MRKKIAVLSKNKMLSRFFELEAHTYGFEICVLEKMPENFLGYSLVIVDIDTVRHRITADAENIRYISQEIKIKEDSSVEILSWPLSVERIRDIFLQDESGKQQVDKSDDEIITLSKDNKNVVRYLDKLIYLTDLELSVLKILCKNKGQIVLRDELNTLLGINKGNMVDVYIHKLRKKLEESAGAKLIYSVRGSGYKIVVGMEQE